MPVGAAAHNLQGYVIGDKGDVSLPSGFVTAKQIKVGAIQLGRGGDERGFTMTGSQCRVE